MYKVTYSLYPRLLSRSCNQVAATYPAELIDPGDQLVNNHAVVLEYAVSLVHSATEVM